MVADVPGLIAPAAQPMVRLRTLTGCSNIFLLATAALMSKRVATMPYALLLPLEAEIQSLQAHFSRKEVCGRG